jgi:hypothetical protein
MPTESKSNPPAAVADPTVVLKGFSDAWYRYAEQLQSICLDLRRRYDEHALNISRSMNQAPALDPRVFGEASRQLAQLPQQVWNEAQVQTRVRDAYRGYLKGVQEAWGKVDLAQVDTCSLIAIGQSLAAAAQQTCATGATGL